MALWKTAFVSEHLHSLHGLSVAVFTIPVITALPGKTVQRAQNTLSCVLSNTYTFALTQMRRSVLKPFVRIKSMTPSNKFTFDFLEIAENV